MERKAISSDVIEKQGEVPEGVSPPLLRSKISKAYKDILLAPLSFSGSPAEGDGKMVPREGLHNLSFTFQPLCLPNRDSSPAEAEVWVWDTADSPTGVVTSGSKVRPMTTTPCCPNPAELKYHHSS